MDRNAEKFLKECKDSGRFDEDQMLYIRRGFELGLTLEQIEVYAKPEFSWTEMWQIREGFEKGLTLKQVKLYADPKFDCWQMQQIRLLLETEEIEFVKSLVKNKNNFDFYVALAM